MSIKPWRKLDNSSLSLIKNILMHSPENRFTIKDIKQHRWFIKNFEEGMYRFVYMSYYMFMFEYVNLLQRFNMGMIRQIFT